MKLRSAFTSAPAVAGFALLALVIGAIVGVRSGMDDGNTDVAGTVVERPEPAATEAPSEVEIQEPVIVRPRREPRNSQTEAPADEVVVVDPPAPAPPPASAPVGLVRDPEPATDPEPTQPRRDRNPDPQPQPDPEPTREPQPEPDPEPTASPEPDPARYALRPGDGVSRDTAEAMQAGESGKYDWQIRSLSGHDNQSPETQRSREAMARLEVGFNEEAMTSKEQVRDFRCDALLSAGSRRLITDTDHVFEIALWTTDGYSLLDKVDAVLIRKAVDLDAGETQNLYSNVYTLDAADGISYTCSVTYRER